MRSTCIRTSTALFHATLVLLLFACSRDSKDTATLPDPQAKARAATAASSPSPAALTEGALHLGAPIERSARTVSLSDVAKNPSAFVGKTFATTGTVTAVCRHKGCWMEIKDDAGEAHVTMAGHSFFVPKTASGHKARVLATLVKSDEEGACAEEGDDDKMAAASGAANGAHAEKTSAAAAGRGKGTSCKAEAEAQLGRPLAKLELVAEGVELM